MCVKLTIRGRVSLFTIRAKLPIISTTGQPPFTHISMKALRLYHIHNNKIRVCAYSSYHYDKMYLFWDSRMSCTLVDEQSSVFHTAKGVYQEHVSNFHKQHG